MEVEYTAGLPTYYDSEYQRTQIGYDWRTEVSSSFRSWEMRESLVKKYSWAIPTEEALEMLARFRPIVEIGAGTGYWAYELRKRGVTIEAYDQYPPDGSDLTNEERELYGTEYEEKVRKNWYHRGHTSWTEVQQGTPEVLKTFGPEWNLFLCWPPMSDMAMYSLGYHRGKYIIYVGESSGGCNADRKFFRLLNRFYDIVDEVNIPQWPGIHDYMTVYRHKTR
jgi:hypothetical protein